MSLPADYTDLASDGAISGFNQTTLHYRDNNSPVGPLKHKEVDSNFELLRQKVNAAGAGNNALKTIYGDTASAAASAAEANTSKLAAETAKGLAETAKGQANGFASNASSSASSAATSASNAAGSASSASQSATTATARANELKNLKVSTGSPGSNASYNASNGTLTVPRGNTGATGASPTFSFSGGTLTITNV